jgi:hypothetical protein
LPCSRESLAIVNTVLRQTHDVGHRLEKENKKKSQHLLKYRGFAPSSNTKTIHLQRRIRENNAN